MREIPRVCWLALLTLALGMGTASVLAQIQGRVVKVCILQAWAEAEYVERLAAFKSGLADLGHVEARNMLFEIRSAGGRSTELPRLAAELVDLKCDVIFAATTATAIAAQAKTRQTPIVIAVAADPVGAGLAASLARPGGNVTGMTTNNVEIVPKRLQLLREIAGDGATRAAMLYSSNDASNVLALRLAEQAARRMGITLKPMGVVSAADLKSAFDAMRAEKIEMLFVSAGAVTDSSARAIAALAAESRIPAIYGAPEFVEAGGLVSYSTDFAENFRAAAAYVDKVLKGARPSDLAIEQSNKYLLVFNAGAAKALGLNVPAALLARVDRVVE